MALCTASVLALPASLEAQGKDLFIKGLVDFSNAALGAYGDEGPALVSALEAMEVGLGQWDSLIARVESGFASEIRTAPPAVAARMRAALGTVYFERGRIAEALSQFDEAASLDPHFADVHGLRGLAYERLGRQADAADAYRSLWQSDPSRPAHAYLFLRSGTGVTGTGVTPSSEAAAAIGVLLTALDQRRPPEPGALFTTVTVADLDDAVSSPLFLPAAYGEVVTHLQGREYDQAVARLRVAVAADPMVSDTALRTVPVQRALASLRQGLSPGALTMLAETADAAQSAELHRVLGLAHADAGQFEQSLAHLHRAAQWSPANERIGLAIADTFVATGDFAAASAALREVLRRTPDSGLAQWKLGRLLQAQGDEAGALRAFASAATLPIVAGAGHVLAAMARLYHSRLELDAAADAYRRRVALMPNNSAAHYDLGDIYHAQGRSDAALTEYVVAALLDPTSASAFIALGQMHAAQGDDEAAARLLRHALALEPGHLEGRYALSRALVRLGRSAEAREQQEVFERLQRQVMEDERRRFRDNQMKIEEVLSAEPGAGGR